jgi:hypothetical protein
MKELNQLKGNSGLFNPNIGQNRKAEVMILRLIITILLLAGSIDGAWAQSNQSPTQSVCTGNEPYLVTATPGSTYTWTITPGISGTQWSINGTGNSITVDWNIEGVYTLTVAERNIDNCDGPPQQVAVTVSTIQPTIVPAVNPVCLGTTGAIYTTELGMTNYTWVVTGGLVTAGGTPVHNTVTVTWIGTGPYSVSVNYENGNGCTATNPTIQNVTVTPVPVTSPIYHN